MSGNGGNMTLKTKTFLASEIKVLDAEKGILEATLSTNSIDRDGEVLDARGWNKKSFDRLPLVANHDYGGGGLFGNDQGLLNQLGHWEHIRVVDDSKLIGEPHYYIGKGNPQADYGFQLAADGHARYSVGFIAQAWQDHEDGDGKTIPFRTFTRMNLIECSHVIIPSNPDAEVHRGKAFEEQLRKVVKDVLGIEGQVAGFTEDEKALILEASQEFIDYVKANPAKFLAINETPPETPPEPEKLLSPEDVALQIRDAIVGEVKAKREGVLKA